MATTTTHYSVLLVEDNQDLVIGLQDLLRHDGYAVTVAGTVAGAIELVRAHRFNAIILDLGLPDGDGLDVLKEVRRLDPSLPVVIVTAHISRDRTVGSLTEGAYAYLTKPYDRDELRHTLRRAIGLKELAVKVERTERLLSQSEERLELVIQGSNDGFWDGRVLPDEPWSAPHTPVWWSPRVKTMLGYTDEEFPDVLESWTSRLHPEDTDRVFAALTAHIDRRVPYDVEYRLLTKTGEYQWFRARGQAIWDHAGHVLRMSGSLQCVTDRKRAEDALRRSEQLLQDVADNTTAVIYVKDADGRFLFTNRRFEQLFHLTTEQIVGHTNHEIFPREIADAFRANDLQVLERNSMVEYEELAPHEDGLHTYLSIKFPLRDHTGKPYATCGISTDITERKRFEHTLRTHEQQLRLALTSAEVGAWNWDLHTDHIYWSSQVDRILGLSDRAQPRTKYDWQALVYREDRESMVRAMRQVMNQAGADVAFEHRVMNQNGSIQWLVWIGEILRDREGHALHILGTVRATASGV
ncbi:MAG TPA: PAS domain-containing protein [Nitrospiraceae bacterium]|nr:PAS domain-containing protein [Nitrospiraceae bacterium]